MIELSHKRIKGLCYVYTFLTPKIAFLLVVVVFVADRAANRLSVIYSVFCGLLSVLWFIQWYLIVVLNCFVVPDSTLYLSGHDRRRRRRSGQPNTWPSAFSCDWPYSGHDGDETPQILKYRHQRHMGTCVIKEEDLEQTVAKLRTPKEFDQ